LSGSDFEAVNVSALQVSANSGQAVQPVPLPQPPAGTNYDIDGDGHYDALTDGLLMIRYMSGLRGAPLTAGAMSANATRSAAAIETLLGTLGAALDIDGDNVANAATDGLLLLRMMLGVSTNGLTPGVLGVNATRTSGAAVSAYMNGFLPPLP
jgi:hypothetical protein